MKRRIALPALGILLTMAATSTQAESATALYQGAAVVIEETLSDPVDLWVTPEDLTRINGFELKPEGACLGPICIPVDRSQNSELYVTRLGKGWINASGLARKVNQGYTFDADARVWSFSPISQIQSGHFASAEAPDFALQNRTGETIRLSDFRGKKVLIITWASW